jgi:hypothetical protein
MGGLGNQLFQYFAGKHLETRSGEKVIFDLSRVRGFGSFHGHEIVRLSLGKGIRLPSKFDEAIGSIRTLTFRGAKRLEANCERAIVSQNYYLSKGLGFDPSLETASQYKFVIGYFQTWRYFDHVNAHGEFNAISVKNPSTEYTELVQQVLQSPPIVIHIRRGDYVSLQKEFGLLSVKYYLKSLNLLFERLDGYSPIWIFSDDYTYAKTFTRELSELVPSNIRIIQLNSPAESLILMSYARAIIIANSTFSWWAAKLNSPKIVVAPNPWFRGIDGPEQLIPSHWVKSDSVWL